MANIYDKQIETMQKLINYGVNENTHSDKAVVEYHAEAADGKTYGIIRECNKYYIKVAPKKDTALVAEDYDYIGGFNNRKENEYNSYNVASKQFDLKMKSLNEVHENNKKSTYQFKPVETAEWQINETKEMRAELNRFNDILYNVNGILSEDKNFTTKHTLPEAPASNPSTEKVNGPFTKTAVAKGDKDLKATEKNYKKAGAPFDEDGTIDNADMQSTKNPKTSSSKKGYCEKPKYVETGVAGQHPTGAKAVKMNEDKKIVKITEQQVLAWSKERDYMDKSQGTEIGSSEPFERPIQETEHIDVQDDHTVGCGKIGDTAPFDDQVNENSYFHNDSISDEEQLDDVPYEISLEDDEDYVPFPEVEDDFETEIEVEDDDMEDGPFTLDTDEYEADDEDYLDDDTRAFMESKIRKSIKEGMELNDFGKHPAYRKAPMTLPSNTEVAPNGERDWNDDSVKGEKPFGSQIGDSSPYNEKVLNMIIDMVTDRIMGKKKS